MMCCPAPHASVPPVLQDTATLLHHQLIASETGNQALEQDLRDATQKVAARTLVLQDQLTRGRGAARRRLTLLTVRSAATAKKLKTVVAKVTRVRLTQFGPLSPCAHSYPSLRLQGEKVLRVAEVGRRLEGDQGDLLTCPLAEQRQGTGAETEGPEEVGRGS